MTQTRAQFIQAIKASNPGLSVRYVVETQEYRITWADYPVRSLPGRTVASREDVAYYTTDRDDAAATARAMWNERHALIVKHGLRDAYIAVNGQRG